MKKNQISITLGIMCLILTFAIMIQLKTTESTMSTVGQSFAESGLKDEVLRWKERYDISFKELENAQNELEQERKQSVSTDDNSVDKQEELARISKMLGLTEVKGEGIVITVKDKTTNALGTTNDIIHDGDLRSIVNELKNAGAEAISINDQRIVSSTAITCIGTVIQVNDEKVGTPFVIKAIGSPESLMGGLARGGGYLEILQFNYGIPTELKKSSDITIPKYTGVITDKYIKNVE